MPGPEKMWYRTLSSDHMTSDSCGTETLDLESQGLLTFDISVLRLNGTLSNVTELNLDYNSLSSLPTELAGALPFLQVLSVSGNNLKQLPACLGDLKELRTLSMNENEISVLPASLYQLPKLLELHLLGNQFKHLHQDLSQLKTLSHLTLEDNQLVALPSTFGELTSLCVLEAGENNLEHLPESFGGLTNLRVLNLSRNKLLDLPDSFGDLPSLCYVDMSNNFLSQLTPRLASASTSLRKFSAVDNLLKKFPLWMAELGAIQEIHLGNNYIDDELPEDFGTVSGASLRHMDLGANYLDHLPSSIGHLKKVETLHFGSHQMEIERHAFQNGNRISRLPNSFGDMCNLRHLRLDENLLHGLPDSFGDLQSLEYLDLGQNYIRELPSSFVRLSGLKTCLLSKNHLERLPEDFGRLRSLERLRLNTNQLRELPASFSDLANLQTLDLVQNLLGEFPTCLNRLTNLIRVALDDNNFELDIPEVYQLDSRAKYPEDGIHKFVRTTVSHSEEEGSQLTNSLVLALKKGDSIWKSHVAPEEDEMKSSEGQRDGGSDREGSELYSDGRASPSVEWDGVQSSKVGEPQAELENWDMELEEDCHPFSNDEPTVYTHTGMRRSPAGRDVLDFLFVPADSHPASLPVYDMEFNTEDGQFDDAD
ncbi:uncharacterized protein [Diadema antillarum]|uniref:uncharacterized protein n=1 Tax=Diadema antillarum TaxID=105358 RepID=UPI003A894437